MDVNSIPDGGYGWIIVFGSLVLNFIVVGMPRGFGVMYVILSDRFNSTATETAWVHALYNTSRMLLAPLSSYLCDRFTTRRVVLVGSVLMFIGVTSSAFVNSIYTMYFTYGIVAGTGGCMLFAPSLIIVGDYFSLKKGKAMGISTVGAGLGTMAFSAMFTFFIDYYGFLGGLLVIGAIVSHCAIAGALFRPVKEHLVFKRHCMKVMKRKQDEKLSVNKNVSSKCNISKNHRGGKTMDECTSVLHSDKYSSSKGDTDSKEDNAYVENGSVHNHSQTDIDGIEVQLTNGTLSNIRSSFSSNISNQKGHNNSSGSEKENPVTTSETETISEPSWIRKQLKLLENKCFWAYVLTIFVMPCCIMGVFLFIAAHAERHGVGETERALLISVQGFMDIIGRFSFGFVFDLKPIRYRRRFLHSFLGIVFGGITMALAPAASFWSLVTVFGFHGLIEGAYHAQRATILSEIVPREQISMCVGYMTFFQGVGNLGFPLLGGLLRDWLGTFHMTFLLGGGLFALVNFLSLVTYMCSREPSKPQTITLEIAEQNVT